MLPFNEARITPFVATLCQPWVGNPVDSEISHIVSDPRRNVAANTLILAARWAVSYGSGTAVGNLFRGVEFYLRSMFMSNPPRLSDHQVISGTCYWLGQLYQLTYYIARDFTLESIPKYNARVRVLAEDLYHALSGFIKDRSARLVEECVVECDSVEFGEVEYDARPGWLAQREEANKRKGHGRTPSTTVYRPASRDAARRHKELPSLLTALRTALEHYRVPPPVSRQLIRQVLYNVNAQLFRAVITRKDMCTRVRAMQVKTNIQKVEEWIRTNADAAGDPRVVYSITPTVRLLQFLQLIHTCDSLESFLDLQGAVIGAHPEGISWAQARRAVRNYTYEVGEPRMGAEVEEYVDMCAWRVEEAARLEALGPMMKEATRAAAHEPKDVAELEVSEAQREEQGERRTPEPVRSAGSRQDRYTPTRPDAPGSGVDLFDDPDSIPGLPVSQNAAARLLRSASLVETPASTERKGKAVVYRRVSLDKYRSLRYRPTVIANVAASGAGSVKSETDVDTGEIAYERAYFSPARDVYDLDAVFALKVPSFKEWRASLPPGDQGVSEVPVIPEDVLKVLETLT
ncbi:hypothetical protein HDU93_009155 [Gonapodya sp. JEL0774]|nr:hypothetical protein HDU93_009155 [Gonapodya sp. JEL0774]